MKLVPTAAFRLFCNKLMVCPMIISVTLFREETGGVPGVDRCPRTLLR